MKRTPINRRPKKRRGRADGKPMCIRPKCRRVRYEDKLCPLHAADKKFSEATRSLGKCWAKGKDSIDCDGGLQCAHIISRSYKAIRWYDENAVALCAGHHTYYTHRPLEWEQFCRYSGVDWDDLRYRALNDPPMDPVDYLEGVV